MVTGAATQVTSQAEAAGVPPFVPMESVRRTPRDRVRLGYREYLLKLCQTVDNEDEAAELLRQRKWLTCLRFAEGRQLGYINSRTGLWTDVSKQDGDPIYISNVIAYFINALVTEDSRSQVIYDVDALSTRLEMVGAARLAGEALAHIRRHTWKATEQQRESKFAIICGNSFRRTRLSKNPLIKVPVPRFTEQQVNVGGGAYQCTNEDCLAQGDVEELAEHEQGVACPQCGDAAPTIHEGYSVPLQVMDGFDQTEAVEVRMTVVDPFEVKLPLHSREVGDHPWLRWSVMAYRRMIEAQFDWAELGGLSTGAPNNTALLYQREMERSPGNIAQQIDLAQGDSGSFEGLCEFNTYWFEPWFYADYEFDKDTQLAGGQVVPAGTRLINLHPQGMAVSKTAGTIVNVWGEAKSDAWEHRRWDLMPDQTWGRGIEDMLQSQKQRNGIKSLLYECLLKHAAPRTFYNPLKFRRTDMQARPGWAAPMRNAMASDQPASFIYTETGRAGGPELPAFLEESNRDMQIEAGGAFAPQAGMPDADNPTARGKIIMRDAAVALLAPKLQLKAQIEVVSAQQMLRLISKHSLMGYYATRLTEYAEFEVEAFDQCNPDSDLVITARAGSEMPISEDDRRNDLQLALTMGQLPGGIFNPAIPENIRKLALERLNLPLESDQTSPDERKQQIELRRLLLWAEQAEKQGLDIETMAGIALAGTDGQPPIAPVMFLVDNHEVHIARIVRYLLTDEGLKASPYAQRVLMDHVQQHLQGEVLKQQQMSMLSMQAQAPAMAAQAAMNTPNGQSGATTNSRASGQNGALSTQVNRNGSFGS